MKVLLSLAVVSLFSGMISTSIAEMGDILPPLKQYDSVSDIHDIKCKPYLTLIFKDKSWDPVCVKPSSVDKLIERGWASDHDPHHKMNH